MIHSFPRNVFRWYNGGYDNRYEKGPQIFDWIKKNADYKYRLTKDWTGLTILNSNGIIHVAHGYVRFNSKKDSTKFILMFGDLIYRKEVTDTTRYAALYEKS